MPSNCAPNTELAPGRSDLSFEFSIKKTSYVYLPLPLYHSLVFLLLPDVKLYAVQLNARRLMVHT